MVRMFRSSRARHFAETALAAARLASAAALTSATVLAVATAAVAAPRTYGIDEDPIRLGNKALAAGRYHEAVAHFEEAIANEYRIPFALYGKAQAAEREGRREPAEVLYRDAIRARAAEGIEFPEAQARLGLLLLRSGRNEEASRELDRAIAVKDDLWDAQYGRALLLLDAGDVAAAGELVARGKNRRGVSEGEDEYHHASALVLLADGDVAGAELEALRALDLDPGNPEYATLVGRIYEQRGTPALAIDAYEKALAAPGLEPTAPMLHSLGQLYAKEHRWNEARDRYVRAVELDSTYAPALADLAEVFRLAKQPERAARTWLRHLELQGDEVVPLVRLAEAYQELGQYSQAVDAARRALVLEPDDVEAKTAFVRAALRANDPDLRDEIAQQFAALPDTVAWSAADLTSLAAARIDDDPDAARESLRRALELEPELPEALFQQGMVEMRAGRPDSAVAALQRAIAAQPDTPLYHLNLGIALYQANRIGEAIPAFREAVKLRPDLVAGHLLLAQTLAVSDSVSAAAREYEQVLAAEPDNAKALRGLAFCKIRLADYAGAARYYEAATKVEPGNADAWAGLGNAYLGLRNWDGAETAFARARALDPENPTLQKGAELLEQSRRAEGN